MVWIVVLLVLYLGALGFALWISLHPFRTPVFISPGSLMVPQFDFEVESEPGIRIRGWRVDHPHPRGVAVLVHGYMMNRSELTPLAAWMHAQGWSSWIVDLRAHGKSSGKTSTFGVREAKDVLAVARLAKEEGLPAVLLGSSMGAAACAFALAEAPELADGLVLDSAYSQLPAAVLGWWYFLGGRTLRALLAPTVVIAAPFVGFSPFGVDVAKALRGQTHPVLILHGDADTLASPSQAKRNHEACDGRSEIVWLSGCGHSEGRWIHPHLYYDALERFLEKLVDSQSMVSGSV